MSGWKVGQISVSLGGLTPAQPASLAPPPAEAEAALRFSEERRLAGDLPGADQALFRYARSLVTDPELARAADALGAHRLSESAAPLRSVLARRPADAAALWLNGELALRMGRVADAARLLARAVELAPHQRAARYAYATALYRQGRCVEAVAQADRLIADHPGRPLYLHLRAGALVRIGDYAGAIEAYAGVLARHADQPLTWLSYGHVLKTVGRADEAIAAYRRSLELQPSLGEAWWSLANLKTVRFSDEDLARMAAQADRPDMAAIDRVQLHFALGKAHEDDGRYEAAFGEYARGNALRRAGLPYDPEETSAQMRRSKALLTRPFFAARAGQGSPAPDPIFVVGLPRSGSTLVEQILASHSRVEGTQELPDIMAIAHRLGGGKRPSRSAYPDILSALQPKELRELGEEYLARAEVHRRLGRAFFIDKTPNNFEHLGLIQLILPNAKIIDARRHPLGCCFSAFKQHFAEGQAFSYGLEDLGRYYRDYVELMAHFDAVLPGRVHRVIYERMVADPEGEIRRLLDYCGLPFEDACLRFYENDRAVRTASSEQVRRPIFADATEHWRNFEPWLEPLKAALGAVLDAYPEAPAF